MVEFLRLKNAQDVSGLNIEKRSLTRWIDVVDRYLITTDNIEGAAVRADIRVV